MVLKKRSRRSWKKRPLASRPRRDGVALDATVHVGATRSRLIFGEWQGILAFALGTGFLLALLWFVS